MLIEWENDAEAAARHPHDTLVVMAKSAKTVYIDYRFTQTRRTEGRYVWKPGLPEENDVIDDVWIAFRNESQTDMSNSMWVG